VFVGALGLLLITAGLAAADRCHTPLPGTRSLTLGADVTGYRFADGRVVVDWARSAECAGTAVWDYGAGPTAKAATSCQRPAPREPVGADTKLVASDATRIVRVRAAPAGSDAPDRLIVLDRATKRTLASWPLFERPARVALHGEIALLSGPNRHGVFALRISDGRIAQVGIARAGDRPLIGPAGVLYQDDIDLRKRRAAPAERTLNLVPLAAVEEELARPYTTVRKYMSYTKPVRLTPAGSTSAGSSPAQSALRKTAPPYTGADPPRPFESPPITAISMDGQRVALAVQDPAGKCDYVLFWNVTWHYMTRLTRSSGPTCLPTHAPGGITDVSIGGSRAAFAVTYGDKTRVIAAAITDCQEWVVGRPSGMERVAGLAGDGGVLAFAFSGVQGARQLLASGRAVSSVAVVPESWGGIAVQRLADRVVDISVHDERIAALGTRGTVSITTHEGTPVSEVDVGRASAVALRTNVLAVLSGRGTLDVYRVGSGRLLHSWKLPPNATSVDVQYGIALVTAGRDVYAVSTKTGRTAHLFHAPTKVAAQIEAPGAAVQFNAAGRGHIEFLPMSRIEASLR
jgi:hypothetical protein